MNILPSMAASVHETVFPSCANSTTITMAARVPATAAGSAVSARTSSAPGSPLTVSTRRVVPGAVSSAPRARTRIPVRSGGACSGSVSSTTRPVDRLRSSWTTRDVPPAKSSIWTTSRSPSIRTMRRASASVPARLHDNESATRRIDRAEKLRIHLHSPPRRRPSPSRGSGESARHVPPPNARAVVDGWTPAYRGGENVTLRRWDATRSHPRVNGKPGAGPLFLVPCFRDMLATRLKAT